MRETPHVYEVTYAGYLERIGQLDLAALARQAGIEADGGGVRLHLFNRSYRVGPNGIADGRGREPRQAIKVALCRYLLEWPGKPPGREGWVTFKDFRDAAPFAGAFSNNVENAIASDFANDVEAFSAACESRGGRLAEGDWNYDAAWEFSAMPHMPVLLLFNGADEGFAARCVFLFDATAIRLLDPECLAIVGWALADGLAAAAGVRGRSL